MRIVVIGAGVVGLACARELARAGHEVLVLESAPRPGTGISSRNSEVVHAGIYYAPGSLKAVLCVEGRERLVRYAAGTGVGLRVCGKLVVAPEPSELELLDTLAANAFSCGVTDVERLDGSEVWHREPAVHGAGALWSPSTGIVDAEGFVRAMRADAERAGATISCRARVVSATSSDSGGYIVTASTPAGSEPVVADAVVNAAGLESDRIARLPLVRETPDLPAHRFVKGSYVRVRWPKSAAVAAPRCLVYPVPDEGATGLGIHLTVDLADGIRLGPDAEPVSNRHEDYAVSDGVVPHFAAAARRYLDLPEGVEMWADTAGIRPVRSDGTGSSDFYIRDEAARGCPGWVNLIAIDSPGLTAALAIGARVGAMLGGT